MAKFKNAKPGVLGFSVAGEKNEKGEQQPATQRTLQPGEVFEAEKGDLPEHYFTQGWIVEASDSDKAQPSVSATADQPLNPKYDGPNPTQQSGTSANKSETDKAAVESGAYDPSKQHNTQTEAERKKR